MESQKQIFNNIDFLPDATFAIDINGRVIVWSRAIEEMTGIKAEAMLGKNNYEYSIPFQGRRTPMAIDLILNPDQTVDGRYTVFQKIKGCLIVELWVSHLGETPCYLWGKASPIYDTNGRRMGAILSIRDITEQKKSEKALKESEEKFRSIFAQSPIGIEFYDSEGRLMDANSAGMGIFGITDISEINALPIFEYFNFPTQAREKMLRYEPVRFEMGYDHDEVRKNNRYRSSKSGKVVFDVVVSPIVLAEEDSFKGWLVLYQDITERKRSESRIQSLTHELLKAREAEGQRISRDLHDSVAQDLSTLRIGLETLFDHQARVPSDIKRRVSELSATLQNTIRTVRDISYDLHPPYLENFGLAQAVCQYAGDFEEKSQLEVEVIQAGLDGLTLDFDTEINLYRIVQEALNNVWKHANASRVIIKLVASYPNIILRVKYDGNGFKVKEYMEFSASVKPMGLRSMEQRVRLLDGQYRIMSEPARGTEIFVEVPFKEKPESG
ncbi:MAG: PAS domain S-box protein [Desulfobacterales bacterium]|nr:PAS domain S-box protein [Desulfobacterales bacterium]